MIREGPYSEDARQSVHIAMGGFALTLPYLAWWQAIVLASLAVALNLFGLQTLVGRQLYRPGERIGRLASGIVLYPLSVLGLILLFGDRLDIAGASWAILAAGAGMATICTFIYSCPPLRTKQRGIWANVTIAIPRGVLLKVAGWSCVKTIWGGEPWFIGAIFGLFLLGASTTKDFADMEGDARGGCRTLPLLYGVRRAAWMISPSFVKPASISPRNTGTPLNSWASSTKDRLPSGFV